MAEKNPSNIYIELEEPGRLYRNLPREFLDTKILTHLHKAQKSGSVLASLRVEEQIASVALLLVGDNNISISYLYTAERYRGKHYTLGFVNQLLKAVRQGKILSASVGDDCTTPQAMEQFFLRIGLKPSIGYCAYLAHPSDGQWFFSSDFAGKLERLSRRKQERGYRTISFAEADEKLLLQVENSARSDFRNALDPSALMRSKNYIPQGSFLVEKDGTLLAYSLLSNRNPASNEMNQMSEAASVRGSGIVTLPLLETIRYCSFCGKDTVYYIYDNNTESNAFVKNLVKGRELEKHEVKYFRTEDL